MNHQVLSDLDQLIFSVRDKESARLIVEAVAAYRGGALRAAIMSAWIAVAYDIITKARELASQGDAAPKQFVDKLDVAIAAVDVRTLQMIESKLLVTARDEFQFFTAHEFTDLDRLQNDRHLCAHPAFVSEGSLFQPTPELVRAHIVHAIEHLLRHAPLQGKSALARLEADILGPAFPTKAPEIETFIQQRYLDRGKESLIVALIKAMITSPLSIEHAKFRGRERQIAQALAAIGRVRPTIFEREVPVFLQRKANDCGDDRVLAFVRMATADPRFWEWIGEPTHIRIRALVEGASTETIKTFDLFDGLAIENLRSTLLTRFRSLPVEDQKNIIAEHPRREFVGRAIELFAEAGSYRGAEALGHAVILPMAEVFNVTDIARVLDAAEGNDQIRGAGGTTAILEELFDRTTSLLSESGPRWRKFIDTMLRGQEPSDYYAYPSIRERLSTFGFMQK